MSYYKEKVRAFRMIDSMYREGKQKDEIVYRISTIFGFGGKMVEKRLELLENVL